MDDVLFEVSLELPERIPVAPSEELVLNVAEDLLGRAVVDAVALARHALGEAVLRESPDVRRVLVLPSHVGVQDRARALGLGRHEHGEHLLLLGEVRVLRDRPGDDLLAAEVVNRREVGLAERAFELRDVGAHLLPRAVRLEVTAEHVLEGLADLPFVRVVPMVVALAADTAAQAHLSHHLEHCLVGDAGAVDGAQLHRDLAVADAIGEPAEYLGDSRAQLGPGRLLRVRERVVVRRPGELGALQQVGQPVALP